MIKRRLAPIILSLSSILILTACAQRLSYPEQSGVSEQSLSSGPDIRSIPKDEFLCTVGWLDDTTILLALESNGEYGLYSHDLDTGKEQPIRTFSDRLVFVALSANGRRILVQVANQQGNNVMMIDKSGNALAEIRFSEGLLTGVSWNPANEGKLFLSAQKKWAVWKIICGIYLPMRQWWHCRSLGKCRFGIRKICTSKRKPQMMASLHWC
ncbi:MAG TPA: hypothetical protein DCY16_00335 [Trichococcus sp.]|nr:hypothetical protein [Trichococcus sp.]